MSFLLPVTLILFLLVTMFVSARIGERTRVRDERDHPGEANDIAAMEAAILGLMGLLLAFTFTESTERTAERRALVVREIASIETVYNRAALLDDEPRQALTGHVRRYAELHAALEGEADEAAQLGLIEESRKQEAHIWSLVTTVVRANPEMADVLVDSTNEMFAVVTERLAMLRRPAQVAVFLLLGLLAWASAYFAGYAVGAQPDKHRPHLIAFIVVTVMTIYLIVDMQYARVGLIQVTDTIELYDTLLRDLR